MRLLMIGLFPLIDIVDIIGGEDPFPSHPTFYDFLTFMNAKGPSQGSMNNVNVGPHLNSSLGHLAGIKLITFWLFASFRILGVMMTNHF